MDITQQRIEDTAAEIMNGIHINDTESIFIALTVAIQAGRDMAVEGAGIMAPQALTTDEQFTEACSRG